MYEVLKALDADRMSGWVARLASFGPRDPCSRGDEESLKYILRLGDEWGVTSRAVPCRVSRFFPGEARLEVLSPMRRGIECVPQDRTGVCPRTTAQMEYVSLGRSSDYESVDAAGKVLLQESHGLHQTEKVALAGEHGALACVWIAGAPGRMPSAWGLSATQAPLPVVGVSFEDGQWLRRLRAQGPVTLSIMCGSRVEPAAGSHAVMEIPGSDAREDGPVFILIAHRDTTHISPGANDNGSGVAVALELMRVFRSRPLPFRLRAVFSTAEEGGGLGMEQYAREHLAGERDGILGAINLDMLGVGDNLVVVTGDGRRRTDAFLNRCLVRSAARLGCRLGGAESEMGLADIGPVADAGIPATWLYAPDDPRLHTQSDLPQYVDAGRLMKAAEIVACTLVDIGEAYAGPSKGA